MPDNIWSLSETSKSYYFDRVVCPELIMLNVELIFDSFVLYLTLFSVFLINSCTILLSSELHEIDSATF